MIRTALISAGACLAAVLFPAGTQALNLRHQSTLLADPQCIDPVVPAEGFPNKQGPERFLDSAIWDKMFKFRTVGGCATATTFFQYDLFIQATAVSVGGSAVKSFVCG
eukprot:GHVU01032557.1.p2 GENE.GHVU01032557.1~~GHVU01032557.1.p2  ORF type:complete len:108 (+),score=11.22 GHVU01032557.1:108-431(+)